MVLFYNIVGFLVCVIAFCTYRLSYFVDEQQPEFRAVTRVLSLAYLLSGASLFAAQLEPHLAQGEFDILNPLMLLFFYLVSHLFLYIVLLLYRASDRILRRFVGSVWPILGLFGLYGLFYFGVGDEWVYSADDVFARILSSPIFVFRIGLFVASLGSLIYHVRMCYQVGDRYTEEATSSYSRVDFLRSLIVSRFMWNLKALAIWVLLGYFYTTPILEVVSSLLMLLIFALQYWGFQGYLLPDNNSVFNKLTESMEMTFAVDLFEDQLHQRIAHWVNRTDKPYTRSGLTIGMVAREIGVSKNRLSESINKRHANFRSWINDLRIEESRHMLLSKRELSLSEVAEAVGFCDLPAFSRAFKRVVGVSPRTFRNNASTA